MIIKYKLYVFKYSKKEYIILFLNFRVAFDLV